MAGDVVMALDFCAMVCGCGGGGERKWADAILAATAAVEGADLATLNVKHHPMIKGVRAPYARA